MILLTGKQCKNARLLLKWNVRELAFRSRVKAQQIEMFERGSKPLYASARETIAKTLRQEGIEFLDFGEIRLGDGSGEEKTAAAGGIGHHTITTYNVDEEAMASFTDDRYDRYALGEERAMPATD